MLPLELIDLYVLTRIDTKKNKRKQTLYQIIHDRGQDIERFKDTSIHKKSTTNKGRNEV